jgi:short-subunit dehydrogenase
LSRVGSTFGDSGERRPERLIAQARGKESNRTAERGVAGGRKTALITGASTGIGYELAKVFAKEGNNVILVARTQQALNNVMGELQQKYSVEARSLPMDLNDPTAPDQIYATLRKESVAVNFLVNNAGFGTRGFFSEANLESQLGMMQVNMSALVHLTRLFLPDMIKRGEGRILNVASTAAFAPGPLMAVYYATKAFVLSFSQALGNELKGSGVTVTALCPGPTKTDFGKRAGTERTRLFTQRAMDAEPVALAGYRGLMEGKMMVIPGLRNRRLRVASRISPTGMVLSFARNLNEEIA